MFVSEIFDDAEELERFMGDVQALMRRGQPDVAASIVEAQLAELADEGHELAKECGRLPLDAVRLMGWEKLTANLTVRENKTRPITAMSIDLSGPLENAATGDGDEVREPTLETIYYSDNPFKFSEATRDSLIETYGKRAGQWHGSFEDIGGELSVRGLGRVYGSAIALAARCKAGECDNPADHDAATLAQAFVSVRLHQLMKAVIEGRGLPRPMTVLVGSNEAYPHFDAPVMLRDEYEDLMDASYEEDGGEEDESKFAEMKLAPLPDDYDPFASAPDADHLTGAALRARLRASADFEQSEEPVGAPSVFTNILNRLVKKPA